eukprot:6458143-Amphidinium_carterae.1
MQQNSAQEIRSWSSWHVLCVAGSWCGIIGLLRMVYHCEAPIHSLKGGRCVKLAYHMAVTRFRDLQISPQGSMQEHFSRFGISLTNKKTWLHKRRLS